MLNVLDLLKVTSFDKLEEVTKIVDLDNQTSILSINDLLKNNQGYMIAQFINLHLTIGKREINQGVIYFFNKLRQCGYRFNNNDDYYAFFNAAEYGNVMMLQALVEHGLDPLGIGGYLHHLIGSLKNVFHEKIYRIHEPVEQNRFIATENFVKNVFLKVRNEFYQKHDEALLNLKNALRNPKYAVLLGYRIRGVSHRVPKLIFDISMELHIIEKALSLQPADSFNYNEYLTLFEKLEAKIAQDNLQQKEFTFFPRQARKELIDDLRQAYNITTINNMEFRFLLASYAKALDDLPEEKKLQQFNRQLSL